MKKPHPTDVLITPANQAYLDGVQVKTPKYVSPTGQSLVPLTPKYFPGIEEHLTRYNELAREQVKSEAAEAFILQLQMDHIKDQLKHAFDQQKLWLM